MNTLCGHSRQLNVTCFYQLRVPQPTPDGQWQRAHQNPPTPWLKVSPRSRYSSLCDGNLLNVPPYDAIKCIYWVWFTIDIYFFHIWCVKNQTCVAHSLCLIPVLIFTMMKNAKMICPHWNPGEKKTNNNKKKTV